MRLEGTCVNRTRSKDNHYIYDIYIKNLGISKSFTSFAIKDMIRSNELHVDNISISRNGVITWVNNSESVIQLAEEFVETAKDVLKHVKFNIMEFNDVPVLDSIGILGENCTIKGLTPYYGYVELYTGVKIDKTNGEYLISIETLNNDTSIIRDLSYYNKFNAKTKNFRFDLVQYKKNLYKTLLSTT